MNPVFNEQYHERIPVLNPGISRPFWTVIIPTYNCAKFLKETIESVLKQDLGEELMEIIVVDDYSTEDDPQKIVDIYGKGRVQFIRQDENVGKTLNYATGLKSSKGHLIHILHGDDTVEFGFYKTMQQLFIEFPIIGGAFCRCNFMDEDGESLGNSGLFQGEQGIAEDFLRKISTWQFIQPPSIVFKREVYEELGAYDNRLKYIEDWEFYVRAAVFYKFGYTPKALANYRSFDLNSSSKSILKGKRLKPMNQVEEIIDAYLPSSIKSEIQRGRNLATSQYILMMISKALPKKDFMGLFKYTIAFARRNSSLRLWGRWFKIVFN